MKCLVVGDDFPWPQTYGGTLRLAAAIEGIARLGEIDLFTLTYPLRTDPCVAPSALPIRRVKTLVGSAPDYRASRRLRWLASAPLPLELVAATPVPLNETFFSWVDGDYDVVLFSRVGMFFQLGRPRLGPTIVDFVDLEDAKIRARLDAERALRRAAGLGELGHLMAATVQGRLNAARWQRVQRAVAGSADRVVVCSDLDLARLDVANATVIPNGYEVPARPLGRVAVGDPPTVLLQGSLLYGPNADAARRLAGVILPRVRARVPGVRLRLVGEADAGVTKLDHPPEVTVVGRVDAMEPELARADLVAAPIRYGSGTRVKILEAFAHRIPVVSTTVGAEGLGVTSGRHCLIADDDDAFADACVALLEQPDLRRTLVEEAQRLFLERFQWASARDHLEALARTVATAAVGGARPLP